MRKYHTAKLPPQGTQGSAEWKECRRKYLTASNFGGICKRKKSTLPHKAVANLLYPKFGGNAATAHGLREEPETERRFLSWLVTEGASEVSVSHPDLVVVPGQTVLAASPDSIVCCKPGNTNFPSCFAVEYKNPKKLVDSGLTVDDAIGQKLPDFALTVSEGKYELKRNHAFYYQVQGVMAATETSSAAFVIRGASGSMAVAWVAFDADFFNGVMIPRLRKFYFEAILPELSHPVMKECDQPRPYFVEWDYSELK